MKWKKAIFVLCIFSLFVCYGSLNVFAMKTGFSTNKMNEEDQHTFLSNLDLSLLSTEPPKRAIECFDVSGSGMIAIGSKISNKGYISVYDTTGKFQYGYVFSCEQSFGMEWDNTDLIIFFVRSDIAASFDQNGKNIELRKIENTIENNSYWNHSVSSEERVIDGNRYTIRNDMGVLNFVASSYSQLLKTDATGNVTMLYDVNTEQTIKTVVILLGCLIFSVIVVFAVIRYVFSIRKNPPKGKS